MKGRIREALAPGDLFLDARSWDDLSEIAATRQVDLAVIDPAAFGRSAIAAAADFASAFPGLPIIVYTVASPTAAETIIKLSEHGVSHALLHPYEGSPAKIRKELQHTAIEKKYDAEYTNLEKTSHNSSVLSSILTSESQERAEIRAVLTPAQQAIFNQNVVSFDNKY